MKINHIKDNIKTLRRISGLGQSAFGKLFEVSRDNIASYERGTEPKLNFISGLVNYFHISYYDLIHTVIDENIFQSKSAENVIKVKDEANDTFPKVQKTSSFDAINSTVIVVDTADFDLVPIVDISAAAGGCGALNGDYIDEEDVMRLPPGMLKRGYHLCIRVRGMSMQPTIQNGSYLIVRLLNPSEWASISDGEVCVLTDRMDGATYVKRVRNHLRTKGHIVCCSDNPDKGTYNDFELHEDDISNIWSVEFYMSSKFPNALSQFDSQFEQFDLRFERIEEQVQRVDATIHKLITSNNKNI